MSWLLRLLLGESGFGRISVGAAMVIALGGGLGAYYVTTTAPAAAQFSGTFDCYGSTPNCVGLSPATCSQTITSGLQTALNNATGGEVICLDSVTSFGNIALTAKTYSSVVTVQPASGRAATVGGVDLDNVDNLRFTGAGAVSLSSTSLTIAGTGIDISSGCSLNITLDHIIYSEGLSIQPKYSCSFAMNILIDHARFENTPFPGVDGRLFIHGFSTGPNQDSGIVITNTLFKGAGFGGVECEDGIGLTGEARGVVIGPGNEFTDLDQNNCDPAYHVDPLQMYGASNITITGNYFHDNGNGSGAIGSFDGNGNPTTMTNNVIQCNPCTGTTERMLMGGGAVNWVVEHNTFVSGAVAWIHANNGSPNPSGNLVQDSVWVTGDLDVQVGYGTNDHNLNSGLAGTGNVTGTPIFVSSPATGYYHYQLDSSSPGYLAGSDGKSMGITP